MMNSETSHYGYSIDLEHDAPFSPAQTVLQMLSSKGKFALKSGPKRVPISNSDNHSSTYKQASKPTIPRTHTSSSTTQTNIYNSPPRKLHLPSQDSVQSNRKTSSSDLVQLSTEESLVITPNRVPKKPVSSALKSGKKPIRATVTFSSPDRTPSRGRSKSVQQITPEKKVKNLLNSVNPQNADLKSPVPGEKVQIPVTPGPLILESPPTGTPVIAKSSLRTKSSSDIYFSHLSPQTITAEKLSANKAAKRAASMPGNVNFFHHTPVKKIQIVPIKKDVPVHQLTKSSINNAVNTKKAHSIISRSTRMKELVSPSLSLKANSKSSALTSSTKAKTNSKGLKTSEFDKLLQLEENAGSVYDINESGMATPYTVSGSFTNDDEITGHPIRSFGGSLSPVRRTTEKEQSFSSEGSLMVPHLSSEVDSLPQPINRHRIMTTHMRQINDRQAVQDATEEAGNFKIPRNGSVFVPDTKSNVVASPDNSTTRLINKIILTCKDEEENSRSTIEYKSPNYSKSKGYLDCDLSSVDPRGASPKSLTSNLSWTLGRETPVSFLVSEPSNASFHTITDTSDSNNDAYGRFGLHARQNEFSLNELSRASSVIGAAEECSTGTLDRGMIMYEDSSSSVFNERVNDDDDRVQSGDCDDVESVEESDSLAFH